MNKYKNREMYLNTKDKLKSYRRFARMVKIKPDSRVLDVGCGDGEIGRNIGCNYLYGCDLKMDRDYIENYLKVFKCDAEDELPFADNFFDDVILYSVFEYFDDKTRALEECLRVTKKRVIICSPNLNSLKLKDLILKTNLSKRNKGINKRKLQLLSIHFNVDLDIHYVSEKFHFLRSLFGNWLAGGIIGVFEK